MNPRIDDIGLPCALHWVPTSTFWPRLRNRVRSYADLRPEFVGADEQLLDFVADGEPVSGSRRTSG